MTRKCDESLHIAVNHNIGDGAYLQAGITTGWSKSMGNDVFNRTTVTLIDSGNQIFYANLVQYNNCYLDNAMQDFTEAIWHTKGHNPANTSTFYFDTVSVSCMWF